MQSFQNSSKHDIYALSARYSIKFVPYTVFKYLHTTPTLIHQPHIMVPQDISTIYNIFSEPNVVLYMLYPAFLAYILRYINKNCPNNSCIYSFRLVKVFVE